LVSVALHHDLPLYLCNSLSLLSNLTGTD